MYTEPIPFLPEKPFPEPSSVGRLVEILASAVADVGKAFDLVDAPLKTAVGRRDTLAATFKGWTDYQVSAWNAITGFFIEDFVTDMNPTTFNNNPTLEWFKTLPTAPPAITSPSRADGVVVPAQAWEQSFKTWLIQGLTPWGLRL